jgi:mannose/fructose/N-acetylgalactosamine-specific phosphotransferase system component IID
MEKSKIEWTDRTYNPIRVKGGGFYCFKVSPACTHCYAETMARRIAAMQHTTEQPYTNRLIFPEVELNTAMLERWAEANDLQLLIERPDYEGGEIKYELITDIAD